MDNKKNIIWNSLGSTLNCLSSLIFLVIVTRINGLNDAGIFSYGFATACLFFTISIYSTRAFQVTDLNEEHKSSDYLYNRLTTSAIMLIIALLFCLWRGYNLYKSSILLLLCFYKVVETIDETLYGIMQKDNRLDLAGKSMTYRSIINYIVFLVIDLLTNNLIIAIVGLIISYILFMVIVNRKYLKTVKVTKKAFSFKTNRELLIIGWNTFLFTFFTIYLMNAPRYAIDFYLTEELQSIYGIIAMPAMVMSLLSQFIAHPFLVNISKSLQDNDKKSVKKVIRNLLLVLTILGVLVIGAAYLLGIPVLELIYGVELKAYKWDFMIIMLGALFYGLSILISYILIAMRKTFCQVIVVGLSSVLALFISNYLVKSQMIFGSAISYLIIMVVNFCLYFIVLKIMLKKIDKNELSI